MKTLRSDSKWAVACLLIGLMLGVGAGCIPEYNFDRPEVQRGTLGEQLHGVWRENARLSERSPDKKVKLLEAERARFVRAVDTVAPADKLGEIDRFLQESMLVVDSGNLPGLTRKVSVALDRASKNRALLSALSRPGSPDIDRFFSPAPVPNLVGQVTSYDQLMKLNSTFGQVLLDSDGVDRRGQPRAEESTHLRSLLKVLSHELKALDSEPPASGLAVDLRDVLLTEDPRYEVNDGSNPTVAALYDKRGYPKVTPAGIESGLFRDVNGDGLADVDETGVFVSPSQEGSVPEPFAPPAESRSDITRDAYGRASVADKGPVFEYVDLDKTGLNFLLRQFDDLVARGVLSDAARALPVALGPRTAKRDEFGAYSTFEADNALTGVAYAIVHILNFDRIDSVLSDLAGFIEKNSSALASTVHALHVVSDVLDEHPDAKMKANQTLGYDLLPILAKVASKPALWRDVFAALREPVSRYAGQALRTMMRYRDFPARPAPDGPYETCSQQCRSKLDLGTVARYKCVRECPTGEIQSVKTDQDSPESFTNRSHLQRFLLFVWANAGNEFSFKLKQPESLSGLPPIIKFDDAAVAAHEAIAGNLDLKDHIPENEIGELINILGIGSDNVAQFLSFLSPLFGAKLSRKPTPAELTRFLNQTEYKAQFSGFTLEVEPPVGKHGYVLGTKKGHADTMYAAEASGFFDALHPLVEAFSDHGESKLLVEMITSLHKHYSKFQNEYRHADGTPLPMKGANLAAYEQAFGRIFESGYLFESLFRLARATENAETSTDRSLVEQIRLMVVHAARRDGFETYDGSDYIQITNNRTVQDLSRLHVLSDAMGKLYERLGAKPQARDQFDNLASAMADVFLGTSWRGGPRQPGSEPHFQTPGTVALLADAMRTLARDARAASANGQLQQWLTEQTLADLKSAWTGRALPALLELNQKLLDSKEKRRLIQGFVRHVGGSSEGVRQLTLATYGLFVYSLRRKYLAPVGQFVGSLVDPARSWDVSGEFRALPLVSHGIYTLERLSQLQNREAGAGLVRRGFQTKGRRVPFRDIFDTVVDYHRPNPTSSAPYSVQDYRAVFERLAAWLRDDVHGMEQVYDLARKRIK